MTKKNVLLVSLIGVVAFFFFSSPKELHLCGDSFCIRNYLFISDYFIIFFPALFFSIVACFLKEDTFRVWARFSIWWIPFASVVNFLVPNDCPVSGGYLPMNSWCDKPLVAPIFAVLFFVISVLIIAVKSYQLRGK